MFVLFAAPATTPNFLPLHVPLIFFAVLVLTNFLLPPPKIFATSNFFCHPQIFFAVPKFVDSPTPNIFAAPPLQIVNIQA